MRSAGGGTTGASSAARADDVCEGVTCNVSPVRVEGIERFSSIAAGGDHTCGISDGALFCWGSNQYGQLGLDASIERTARPSQVPIAERASSVAARGLRTCVVMASGRQTCWGFRKQ